MANITVPYNLDLYTNATDIYGMAAASNEIVGGLYGITILIVTAFLIFVTMRGYDTKTTMLSSATFTWLVSLILFTPLEFITAQIFGAMSAIAIATIILVAINKD